MNMSRRITKAMADSAAFVIADEAYEARIDKARKKLSDYVATLVERYYPQNVLEAVEKYKDYLYTSNTVYVAIQDDNLEKVRIPVQVPYRLPYDATVKVPIGCYARTDLLNIALRKFYYKRNAYQSEVFDFLRGKYIASLAHNFPDYYRVLCDLFPNNVTK